MISWIECSRLQALSEIFLGKPLWSFLFYFSPEEKGEEQKYLHLLRRTKQRLTRTGSTVTARLKVIVITFSALLRFYWVSTKLSLKMLRYWLTLHALYIIGEHEIITSIQINANSIKTLQDELLQVEKKGGLSIYRTYLYFRSRRNQVGEVATACVENDSSRALKIL